MFLSVEVIASAAFSARHVPGLRMKVIQWLLFIGQDTISRGIVKNCGQIFPRMK